MIVSKDPNAALRIRFERAFQSSPEQAADSPKRARGTAVAASQVWLPLAEGNDDDDDVPAENRHLRCAGCASGANPDQMIVCETYSCDTCSCFSCLDVALKELPEYQWLCGACRVKNPCCVCRLSGKGFGKHAEWFLLTCDRCKEQAHAACWGEMDPWSCSSQWRCPDCVCTICSRGDESGPTFECQDCKKLRHFDCDGMRGVDLYAQVSCSSCIDLLEAEVDVEKAEDVGPAEADEGPGDERVGSKTVEAWHDMMDSALCRHPDEPPYRAALSLLQEMRTSKNDTFLFLAFKWYVEKQYLMDKEKWGDLMFSFGVSLLPSVPQKLNRSLAQIYEPVLRLVSIQESVGGFKFQADVQWRDPKEVVTQLYTSDVNRAKGPYVSASHRECNALRTSGTRFAWFNRSIRDKYPNDDDGVEYVFLRLASDGSGTNFTSFHPILISLVNYSADALAVNPMTAQAVLGFLPSLVSIKVTDGAQQPVSISKAHAERNLALTRLSQKAMRELLLDLRRLEDGFTMEWAGRRVRARAFLFIYLTDMMERRWLLDLPGHLSWHCSWCYNDNRTGFDVNLDSLTADLRARSASTTAAIRALMPTKDADGDFASGDNALCRLFGVRPTDEYNPFFLNGKQIVSSFIRDPSALFPSDLLHVVEGVITLLVRLLHEGVYASSLFNVARDFGDTSFSVSNTIAFHKFENRAYNLQFIAAALALGGPRLRAQRPGWNYGMSRVADHARLVCRFLEIFTILKDDAPGECLDDLHSSISVLGEGYRALRKDLVIDETKIAADTCKLHELLEHVEEQVLEFGCARDYGTYLTEWFHPVLKAMLRDSGLHRTDQAKKMLCHSYYRSLFAELRLDTNAGGVRSNEPWSPRDTHVIRAAKNRLGLARHLADNWQALAKRVPSIGLLEAEAVLVRIGAVVGDVTLYGDNLECSIRCATRDVGIKSAISFYVPTHAGRDLKVISYRLTEELLAPCSAAGCRHHDARVHLFPPHFRATEDLHGIPILYVAGTTGSVAVVVKLGPWDPEFECDAVLRRFAGPFEVELVPISMVRDYCLAIEHDSEVYVFRAGSRVFNHLV
jgi:hypothetical protein